LRSSQFLIAYAASCVHLRHAGVGSDPPSPAIAAVTGERQPFY